MGKSRKITEPTEEKVVRHLTKKQRIGLLIIFVSFFIIVYVAFSAMSDRPVTHYERVEAEEVIKHISGTAWILDDYGKTYPLSTRGINFKKLEMSHALDQENLRLPFYLYYEDESLSRVLALIEYDQENTSFKAKLPNAETYDFDYSLSHDGKLESISFISLENERTFYIKEKNLENLEE